MAKPVIVTQTRGQVDLIKDGQCGFLVPPADAGALRAAIERVLADSTAGEVMGQAGRRLVCERHSLDQYVASLAEIRGWNSVRNRGDAFGERLVRQFDRELPRLVARRARRELRLVRSLIGPFQGDPELPDAHEIRKLQLGAGSPSSRAG